MFAQQNIKKTYTAIVFGTPAISSSVTNDPNGGTINYPSGKPAVTHWRIIQSNGHFLQLELHPKTG
jgi:23S rRNA-/tRNA-specific pseudouridylate synthase